MSYEDADEIKTQLHDAYMRGCKMIGDHPSVTPPEWEAFETYKLKVSVKIEVKK